MAALSSRRFLHVWRSLQKSAKALRYEQRNVLRANRRSPLMEAASRKNTLEVPLDKVQEEWYSGYGLKHLKTVANHFGLYRDMYGMMFEPEVTMAISFENHRKVRFGNIIEPSEAGSIPSVQLPQSDHYFTLTLTTPDGHLSNHKMELLHWMRVNLKSTDLTDGGEPCSYLQPLPPKGAGLLRYIFTLYTHTRPIPVSSINKGMWLEARTFSSKQLMREHTGNLKPVSFNFFQSQWDHSVHKTFMHVLKCPEPVYQLKFE